jgi:hypothetical protein
LIAHGTHRVAAFFISLLGLIACAPPQYDVDLKCIPSAGQTCAAHSSGGEITWHNTQIKPGEDYLLVVMSRESTRRVNRLQHSLLIQSTQPSAPLPREERNLIDLVLRQQGTMMNGFNSRWSNVVASPRFNEDPLDFYVPNPLDYMTRLDNQLLPIFVPRTSGDRRTGDRYSMEKVYSQPQAFDLMVANNVNRGSEFSQQMTNLGNCVSNVLPKTIALIGSPIDLDGKSEINLVVSNFQSGANRQPLGLFFPGDRFQTYRGRPLEDSNFGELIYLSPQPNVAKACSTVAHELQHMVNFDHKVLHRLPSSTRSDMVSQERHKLEAEELGLDEAYSHLVELLSDQSNGVGQHIYNFLTNAHRSSFALEIPTSDGSMNTRTRGANTLLLLFALKRAGGSLSAQDPVTQRFLRQLIQSPQRGLSNVASLLDMNENELLQDFFSHLLQSLFDRNTAQSFLPEVVSEQISLFENIQKGVEITDRSVPISEISYSPPRIHPYQLPIDDIKKVESLSVGAQSMHFYRFRSDSKLSANDSIRISSRGSPFSVFVIKSR